MSVLAIRQPYPLLRLREEECRVYISMNKISELGNMSNGFWEVSEEAQKPLITQIIVKDLNKLTSPFVIANKVKQSQGIATSLHSSQ